MTNPSNIPSTTAFSKHHVEEQAEIRELASDEVGTIAGGPEMSNEPPPSMP